MTETALEQIDWATDAWARAHDPETSHAAAATVGRSDLEQAVYQFLKARPAGATSYQIAEALNLSLVTVSPRLRPLVDKGFVIDSGQRARGESGRSRIIWQAKPTAG